ncbi:MAG: putative bifunctional diguanylate cyclase/phosphodiesterase [Panacagrimonas sp.]
MSPSPGIPAAEAAVETEGRRHELEAQVEALRGELAMRDQTMSRAANLLTSHDFVTALPNRRYLLEALERVRRRVEKTDLPMAVVAIGIEHFLALKASVDAEHFERLLMAAALRIRHVLRPLDVVARISDHVFAALLAPQGGDTAETLATRARAVVQRLEAALCGDLLLEGKSRPLQVRGAFAIYPQDGARGSDLLKQFDASFRLSQSPAQPERRASANPDLAWAVALELRLRRAMQSDRLVPYFQPKIEAATGRLVGGETLIRWPRRNGQHVGPGEFVPIAQASGLMSELDEYVMTRACVQIAEWQNRFASFRIAVNLSALRFPHHGVVDRLRDLFTTTRARPEHLELEITESALITDFAAASRWLHAVREMGVTIALDDFGTGYSSLAYLRELPLDAIKIDQSFVRSLEEGERAVAIVRAMVAMARALGLKVVAEGVETQAQAQILMGLGCDVLQGFLYSEAVPAERFEAMLQAGRLDSPGPV